MTTRRSFLGALATIMAAPRILAALARPSWESAEPDAWLPALSLPPASPYRINSPCHITHNNIACTGEYVIFGGRDP